MLMRHLLPWRSKGVAPSPSASDVEDSELSTGVTEASRGICQATPTAFADEVDALAINSALTGDSSCAGSLMTNDPLSEAPSTVSTWAPRST